MINERKKSLKKFYGWMIENLVDTSKTPNQLNPVEPEKKQPEVKHEDGIEIIKPLTNMFYRHGNKTIKKIKGSKVSISYHKPKKKVFFGSKTVRPRYSSKNTVKYSSKNTVRSKYNPKYYGQSDENSLTAANIKKLFKVHKKK